MLTSAVNVHTCFCISDHPFFHGSLHGSSYEFSPSCFISPPSSPVVLLISPQPEQIWQLSAVPFCFTFFSFSRWRALPHTLPWECHIQQGARRWLRSAAFLSSLIKRQLPVKSLGQKQETDLLLCSGTDGKEMIKWFSLPAASPK